MQSSNDITFQNIFHWLFSELNCTTDTKNLMEPVYPGSDYLEMIDFNVIGGAEEACIQKCVDNLHCVGIKYMGYSTSSG